MVIRVLIKHTYRKTPNGTKEQLMKKKTIKLLISIAGVMFLFGLTWLFGALTIIGLGDSRASTTFQFFFVILNAFQGFFLFLFFCVFNKDARDSWLEMVCRHYKSKVLHPIQGKPAHSRVNAPQTMINTSTASTDLANSSLNTLTLPNQTGFNLSTDKLILEEEDSEITLTSTAKQTGREKPTVVDHKTKIDKIKKVEKEEGQVLETRGNADSERHNSLYQWRENEAELKIRVRRYST